MSIRVGGSSPPITITDTTPVASQAEMLALPAQRGDIAIRTDFTPARAFILTTDDPTVVGNWTQFAVTADPVDATASVKGVLQLTGDLGGTAGAPTVPGKAQVLIPADRAANFAFAAGELALFDTTSGAVVGTLPTTPADKTRCVAKWIAGSFAASVAAGGSAHFNTPSGGTTYTFPMNGSNPWLNVSIQFQYRASNDTWIVTANDLPLSGLDARFARISSYTPWTAATPVALNEVRTVVWTGVGVLTYRSNSARTTGASFDATEASNWTYLGGAVTLSFSGSIPTRPYGVPAGILWAGQPSPLANMIDGDLFVNTA